MSKERLEELLELHEKAVVAYEDCDFLEMRGYLETLFLEGYIDYLIEQAERVQELEDENDILRQSINDVSGAAGFMLRKSEQQNKRYRDILEEVRQNMIGHYGLGGKRDDYVRWSKELIDRELEESE